MLISRIDLMYAMAGVPPALVGAMSAGRLHWKTPSGVIAPTDYVVQQAAAWGGVAGDRLTKRRQRPYRRREFPCDDSYW